MKADKGHHPPAQTGLPTIGSLLPLSASDDPWSAAARAVGRMAFRAAKRFESDVQETKDIVQAVAIRVIKRMKTDPAFPTEPPRVAAFVKASVRNEFLNLRNGERVREEAEPLVQHEIESNPPIWIDADWLAEIEDKRAAINAAFSRLPEMRQKVCVLFFIKKLEQREIGRIYGISVDTVRKHVELAKRDLRIWLREYAPASMHKETT